MSTASTAAYSETDRNLALVAYGLLGIAVFFAGLPGLVAVVIAYSQRRDVCPMIAQHHAFQIRIFWVSFVISLVASACALVGLLTGIGDLIDFLNDGGWDRMNAGRMTLAELRVDALPLSLIGVAIVLTVLTGLWLICASTFGFLRLANQRAPVHLAP